MTIDTETSYKVILTIMLGITSARFKLLLPLVILLAILMVVDSVYGMRAVVYENKNEIKESRLSSENMIDRLFRKVGHLLLILVGLVLDVGIYYGASLVGADINIHPIFAITITVGLVGKELLSIVENYTRCGNDAPTWLGAFGTALQKSAESKGDRYVKDVVKEITKDGED